MTKTERDLSRSDLASLNALIAQLGDEDAVTRMSLEDLRTELEAKIAAEPQGVVRAPASIRLLFSGRPVVGQQGIESEFAGVALERFQDVIAALYAQRAVGALPQRGVIPGREAAKLHVTNLARGSFGFVLEEIEQQPALGLPTALNEVARQAAEVMSSLRDESEDAFDAAVAGIDRRAFVAFREFFGLLRRDRATFRVVTGDVEKVFDEDSIARAAERAGATEVSEDDELVAGALTGVLPEARLFELHTDGDRGTIQGKVAEQVAQSDLETFNRQLAGRHCVATLKVRRVIRRGTLAKETFLLLALRQD